MTGMSWLVAPLSASCPRPARPKIDSAITAPPSSVGTASPSTATAGAAALRSAWPNSTRRGERPAHARADDEVLVERRHQRRPQLARDAGRDGQPERAARQRHVLQPGDRVLR